MNPEIELLDTEEKYVNSLKFIIKSYVIPLEKYINELKLLYETNSNQINDKNGILYTIIKKEKLDIILIIFSNIRQLLDCNLIILKILQQNILYEIDSNLNLFQFNSLNSTPNSIPNSPPNTNSIQHSTHNSPQINTNRHNLIIQFSKVLPTLKFYGDYIRNYENSRELLKRLDGDIRWSSFIRAIELQEESNGLTLESQLSKPWQRIMKYELLFKEIRIRSETIEEKEIITKTIEEIRDINNNLNKLQAANENQKLLLEKQKYYGLKDLSAPARYFVRDGILKIITSSRKKDLSFVLCNDILFYGKKSGSLTLSQSQFKSCNIHQILVFRHPEKESKTFTLKISNEEVFQVEATTEDECDRWLFDIITLKNDEKLKNMTGRKDIRRLSSNILPTTFEGNQTQLSVWEVGKDGKGSPILKYYRIPPWALQGDGVILYDVLEEVNELSLVFNENVEDYISIKKQSIQEFESQDDDTASITSMSSLGVTNSTNNTIINTNNNTTTITTSQSIDLTSPISSPSQLKQFESPTSDPQCNEPEISSNLNLSPSFSPPPPSLPPSSSQNNNQNQHSPLSTTNLSTQQQFSSRPISMPVRTHQQYQQIQQSLLTPSTPTLPPGWEQKRMQDGRIFYVDHNTKTTHWIKPN